MKIKAPKKDGEWVAFKNHSRWENKAFHCEQAFDAWDKVLMMDSGLLVGYEKNLKENRSRKLLKSLGKPICYGPGEYHTYVRGWAGSLNGFTFCAWYEGRKGISLEVDDRCTDEETAAMVIRISELILGKKIDEVKFMRESK